MPQQLVYAGCNLFGQMVSSSTLTVDEFATCHIEQSSPLIDIALGHSIIVMLHANGVFFHGHGLKPRDTHRITKMSLPPNAAAPKLVCASDTSVFLLDQNGSLFMLDLLNKTPAFIQRHSFLLRDSALDSDNKVVDFVAGCTMNVARTEYGDVYNAPNKVDLSPGGNGQVTRIRVGHEHCLLLDSLGNVYSFGNGSRGQLGHGVLQNEEGDNPKLVETLAGIFIVDIACGGWHSMALSRDGDVYIWGWNSDGQVGILDDTTGEPVSVVPTPQYLPLADDLNVSFISAGARHSICITSTRNVFAFGCNKFNQLGIPGNDSATVRRPTRVHQLQGVKVLRVVCGPTSTAILTEDN